MRGGSTAMTPEALRRSSACSRRMNSSSVRGSRRTAMSRSLTSTAPGTLRSWSARLPQAPGHDRGGVPGGGRGLARVRAGHAPLYLHHLTPSDYGVAETIVTAAVLLSIPLRLGLSDALVRFWYLDDDRARQLRLGRNVVAAVGLISTLALVVGLFFAGPLSEALLGFRDSVVLGFGLLGLWAFS